MILFAGHGTYYQKQNTVIGYWVPVDAEENHQQYISNTSLNDLVARCSAKHILILSDACYSGAFRGATESTSLPRTLEYKLKSRQILTSVGLEKAPEKSVFIDMVISVLKATDEPFLSAKDLYHQIYQGVANQTSTKPGLDSFGQTDNQGGQFYFIKAGVK